MPPTLSPSRSATSRVSNSRGVSDFLLPRAPRPHKESCHLQLPAGNPPREFPVSSQPDERFFSPPLSSPFMRHAFFCRCACKPRRQLVHLPPRVQIQRSGIHRNSHPGKLHFPHLSNAPIKLRRGRYSI